MAYKWGVILTTYKSWDVFFFLKFLHAIHTPRISIEEFNGPAFQTNLAILLGIPPERIVVSWMMEVESGGSGGSGLDIGELA